MALSFECVHCSKNITSKFLKIGDEIKCPACNGRSIIPENADTISDSKAASQKAKDNPDMEKSLNIGKNENTDSKNSGLHVDIEAMFGEPLLKVDGGATEILYLYKKKLVIAPRKTLMGKLQGGGHEIIYLKHIKDIEFKYGGSIANGYIQFRTSASGTSQKSAGFLGAGAQTVNDPNTVHFRKKMNDKMFKILELVDKYIEN